MDRDEKLTFDDCFLLGLFNVPEIISAIQLLMRTRNAEESTACKNSDSQNADSMERSERTEGIKVKLVRTL